MADHIQILLVEDSDYDIAILSARLRTDARFSVHSERRLDGAMQYLESQSADVILMDLNLPDSSGFETFEKLNSAYPHLPIIVLTGDDDEEKAIQAVAAGAQDFVPKLEGDLRVLSRSILYAFERNARRVIQKRQAVVDNDLATARRIQEHLLPEENAAISGFDVAAMCRPVAACGGDFFDFVQHQNFWDIVIADVSGHGFAAAIIMAQTKAVLRALGERIDNVAELLTVANRQIFRDTPADHFVSMFYARLVPATGQFSYAIAGHPATIFRADGKTVRLEQGGPVLGIVEDCQYATAGEEILHPGDRLVLTTDGIQEAVSPSKELFGRQRVEDLVTSAKSSDSRSLIQTVIDAATVFSDPERVQDDMTMMVLTSLATGT